ncbi:hypothetical protein ABK040_008709 [Willaertia magna]
MIQLVSSIKRLRMINIYNTFSLSMTTMINNLLLVFLLIITINSLTTVNCLRFDELLGIKKFTFSDMNEMLEDANCSIHLIERMNNEKIYPIVNELTSKQFFKIFKVDLSSSCPFWVMKKVCTGKGGCSVCECDEREIPIAWKQSRINNPTSSSSSSGVQEDKVNKFLGLSAQGRKVQKWKDVEVDSWTKPEGVDTKLTYVNLINNPETRTGYSGEEASRVWKAIYSENCFKSGALNDMCFEERVFYRLISGLHASTTMKIARYFHKKFGHEENTTYDSFTPNYEMFEKTLVANPDRVKNIYFLYTFMLRAIEKATPFLKSYNFNTGNELEDLETSKVVNELLDALKFCSTSFDESKMFNSEERISLRNQMKATFRNITAIMDCVACEKCKMWAKLEVIGLATALKILLDGNEVFSTLQRNEIIALINAFKQHSQSIYDYQELYITYMRKDISPLIAYIFVTAIGIAILFFIISICYSKQQQEKQKKEDVKKKKD